MGICPYCKAEINLNDLQVEKKGIDPAGQERLYTCPFCDFILGVSNFVKL